MDIKTETFGTITAKAFNAALGYLGRITKKFSQEFNTALIYSVATVFQTGDATHINKVLPVLVALKAEPWFYKQVVGNQLIPFNYNRKDYQFTGKIDAARRATLEMIVNGIPQWEIVLRAALDGATAPKKETVFNLDTRSESFVKAARKAHTTDREVLAAVKAMLKKHPVILPDSTSLSAEDQVRVKENKARHTAEVKKAQAVAKAA